MFFYQSLSQNRRIRGEMLEYKRKARGHLLFEIKIKKNLIKLGVEIFSRMGYNMAQKKWQQNCRRRNAE
jgi:hypothetical protein